ncbi:MAG: hypothetical protein AAGJ38_00960 [Planctomycetota bacterium]
MNLAPTSSPHVRRVSLAAVTFVMGITGSDTAFGNDADEAVLVYRETFTHASDRPQPLSAFGWSYHLGSQGWDEQDNTATHFLVNENPGSSADSHAIGLTPEQQHPNPVDAPTRGFVVNALGPDGGQDEDYWNQLTHYATTELVVDRKTHRLTAVSFDLALTQPDAVRITVQIGERWFASTQTFTQAPPAKGPAIWDFHRHHAGQRLELVGDAIWLPLNFVPNTTLGLDTSQPAVVLPEGDLTGLGLLLQPTGHEAFDNVSLFAVPR